MFLQNVLLSFSHSTNCQIWVVRPLLTKSCHIGGDTSHFILFPLHPKHDKYMIISEKTHIFSSQFLLPYSWACSDGVREISIDVTDVLDDYNGLMMINGDQW